MPKKVKYKLFEEEEISVEEDESTPDPDDLIDAVSEMFDTGEGIVNSIVSIVDRVFPKQQPQENYKKIVYKSLKLTPQEAADVLGVKIDANLDSIMEAFKAKIAKCNPLKDDTIQNRALYLRYHTAYTIMKRLKQNKTIDVPHYEVVEDDKKDDEGK